VKSEKEDWKLLFGADLGGLEKVIVKDVSFLIWVGNTEIVAQLQSRQELGDCQTGPVVKSEEQEKN
jgi:hypothetical protein